MIEFEKLAKSILIECCRKGVQDLHFLPQRSGYLLKRRTQEGYLPPEEISDDWAERILNHLKFNAEMDLTEHRRPQLGAWQIKDSGQTIYLRMASVGNFLNRESLVIRFIYPLREQLNCLLPAQMMQLQEQCQQRGLIVFAGPTGAGKTSTMYYLARQLQQDKLVMAIEDPIEIYMPDFLQVQVNLDAKMSYPKLLKASLRHRPEILIIGEIRDHKTAIAAVRAALSGHLVFSTVHARSAQGIWARLTDFGVRPEELRMALNAACYQRLMPRTNGETAVLYDLQTQFETDENPLQQWQQNLQEAQRHGSIDAQTRQQFWYG